MVGGDILLVDVCVYSQVGGHLIGSLEASSKGRGSLGGSFSSWVPRMSSRVASHLVADEALVVPHVLHLFSR